MYMCVTKNSLIYFYVLLLYLIMMHGFSFVDNACSLGCSIRVFDCYNRVSYKVKELRASACI